MAKNDWGDALVTAESPLDWGDRPAAQQDLPDGVKPSTAGGGRGVTPPQAYARPAPAATVEPGADTMSAEFGGPQVVDEGPRVSVLQDQPMAVPDPARRLSLGAGPINQETAARAERMVNGQDPGVPNRAVVERAARGIQEQVSTGERNTFGDLVDTATLEDRRAATGREIDAQRRREFAETNPVMGGVASGAAGLVAGMINTPQLAADAFNKTVVDPVLQAAGQDPMPSPGQMPGTQALTELAAEYAPVVGQQPMGDAWDKGEFGPWLVANLAQQSPQIAQSIAAAFAPPLRAILLPAMGAQSAGMSYVAGDDPRIALAKGAVEIGTEMLPLKVFDRVGEILARVPANAQRTVLAQAGQKLMAAGGAITANALTNAVEESVAQVSGNALDQLVAGKEGSLPEGVGEAAVIGGLTGAGIGAPQAVVAGARDNTPQGQAARELSRALDAPVPQQTVAPTGLNPNLRPPTDRTEQIKALRAAGDKTAADLLQRRQDREMSAYTAERETEALQPFGAGVQQRYREMRLAGAMPGDAVTQTAMRVNFEQAAQAAGLSEKARDAALKQAETMPPDKAPGFLQKALQAFTSKGLAKPIEGAERLAEIIETQRDELLDAVLTADIRPTMAAIEELEQAAPVAQQAPVVAPQVESVAENDVLVTPETDAVHAAATSPLNDLPEPTQAQKEAGNYKLGRVRIGGMDIAVENPQGSMRRGTAPDGTKWETPMRDHYGYFNGTTAADGDKLDVFVKPGTPPDFAGTVFVVDQVDPETGKFDEAKVVFGATDQADAEAIYRRNYRADWQGLGAITPLPMPAFKAWATSQQTRKPLGVLPTRTNAEVAPTQSTDREAAPDEAAPAAGSDATPQAGGVPAAGDTTAVEADGLNDAPGLASPDEQRRASADAEKKRNEKRARLTSNAWGQNPFRAFLGKHGISSALANEFAPGAAERRKAMVPGYGPIFRKAGKNIDMLAEAAREEGFIQGEDTAELYDLIARVFRGEKVIPMFAEGAAEMEMESRQAAMEEDARARFEDYAAADLDPFTPDDQDLLEAVGYDQADAATQAEFRALIAAAEAEGIDTETILEDAHYATQEASDDQYRQRATADIQAARSQRQETAGRSRAEPRREAAEPAGPEDGQPVPGTQSAERPEVTATLRADGTLAVKGDAPTIRKLLADAGITNVLPMRGGILVGKSSAKKAQALLDPPLLSAPTRAEVEAQQERTEKAARDTAKKDADAKAEDARDRERREVARRSEAAADTFELGQDPMANLTGQTDIFAAAPAPAPAPRAASRTAPIEDFGEKLVGARKDYATQLKEAQDLDVSAVPLSQSWPEPDYQKLLDGGTPRDVVDFIHAARDHVPTKPQKSWKLKGWVAEVEALRALASDAMAGKVKASEATLVKPGTKPERWQDTSHSTVEIRNRAELYQLVGHSRSLKGVSFSHRHYSLYKGQENVSKWVVSQRSKSTAFGNWPTELAVGDTKQEMLDQFKAKVGTAGVGSDAKAKHSFVVYRKRGEEGAFIGKKIGREYIDLHKAADVAAARKYLTDNVPALEKALERYKQTPMERNKENAPRVGDDHRNGAPVTPEVFSETFGFRGVQFGNYVEQGRRQSDLNEAFDALMDMAAVLGLPPRALSLNGRLGLAFGARGRGGKDAPAAHYEPGNVVINLTKGGGPGSLAHEWFHSMDNYFAKEGGGTGYMTDGARGDALRAEMREAFMAIKRALNTGGLRMRSLELDKRRAKPYWSTSLEMAARSFESYIIAKLHDQNASNDYLANVVSPEYWAADEALRGAFEGKKSGPTFPYPTVDEMPALRAAFDDFFKTVQTKETDEGVAMFARAYHGTPHRGIERFSTDNVGTGEGAQAYGWGLYFASKREIAEHYRTGLSYREIVREFREEMPDDADFDDALEAAETMSPHRARVVRALADDDWLGFDYPSQAITAAFRNLDDFEASQELQDAVRAARGQLYEVNIPEDSEMLLWDKPIGEQGMRQAVFDNGWQHHLRRIDSVKDVGDFNGSALYRALTMAMGSDRAASEAMAAAGIKGIKYLDGVSRGAGEGSYNYVVFSGDDVAIEQAMYARASKTDSPEFQRWFGDSKVVDAKGQPLVVYHGTRSSFDTVDTGATQRLPGFWVTDDPALASTYAAEGVVNARSYREGANVMPLYAKVDRPYRFNPRKESFGSAWEAYMAGDFDGFIETGNDAKGAMTINVKTPGQIKSAIGNRGTFDSSDPDIRASRTLDADLFRRMTTPMKRGMEVAEVESAIAPVLKRWKNGPTVQVVSKPSELPVDAPDDAQGLYIQGRIYLVASTLRTPEQVQRALGHEAIAHHGLREMLGRDGFRQFTNQVQLALKTGNKALAVIQAEVRAAYVDEAGRFNLTPGQESDEIAAKVVEQAIDANGNFRPGFGFVKAVYARIAEFLRDLGISVRFTHAELQGMLVNSQRRLEAGQRTAGARQAPQPVWARSNTPPISAAIVGEGLGAATGHPKYAAAKAGDVAAAVDVARTLVTPKLVDQVREVIGDSKPVVVPVISVEATGRNKIPLASAELLAQRLGLATATDIVQANSPRRTAMDGLDRIFASPEFDGPVVAGQDYVILDDTLTQGATFATLAAHIEAGGGRVVGAVALTGKQYSAKIQPSPDTLKALREKLGDLETDFRAATGYGFDALTESEARYLTNFKPAESVRARIVAERDRARQREDQGDADGLTGPAFARDATLKTPAAVQAEAEIDRQNPPTAGQPDLFTPGFWETPQDTRTDKFIFEVQDGRIDLKRVQEAIAKVGGQIREQFDARLAETLYPGRVAQRAQQFLEDEAKPLLEVMARNNVPMAELSDYLHARGAEERNAQIAKVNPDLPDGGAGRNSKGVLLTNAAAREYLAAVTPARKMVLDALAKRVDAITSGTRKLLVDEGLEKAETIEAWEKAYSNYVPMFRDEAEAGRPHPTGSGMSVRGSTSKRATGSTKAVTNILAHVLMQREAAITRAEKNRVAVALYGMALTNPNPDFWTTIRPGMAPEAIGRELQRMGVDPTVAEAGMEGVPTIRTVDPVLGRVVDRPNPMYKSLPGAIVLKVNGEDRVLMLNERDPRGLRMAENLKNLDGLTRLDLANRMVGKATRWLASVNTQYNPAFGLVNLTRDTLGGAINLSSTRLRGKTTKVLALTPAAIRGIALELSGAPSGEWGKLWRQFQADGGQTGYREMFKDANDRTARLQAELKSLEKAGKLTSEKVAGKILGALDIFNTTLENAVRLAAYREALQEGMSRAEAARLGRELTVDFNRKGRTGREVGPLYAFFNASVQGSARTLQTLAGPAGAKIIAGGVMLGVMQAIMLLLAGYEDDEIPEFIKTRALIVPLGTDDTGKKQYFTIPYPLGLHVLPNTGRVLAELTLAGGDGAAKRGMEAIGEIAGAFNPLGGGNIFTGDGFLRTVAPSVVDPIVETLSNRNFAGAPIERESQGENDPRPGFQRAREATLRTATGQTYTDISRIINTMTGGDAYEKGAVSPSPEMVRYWAQVVGGGLLREIEKIVNTSVDVAKNQPVKPSGVPVFGRFYGEVEDANVQRSRYYDNLREIERAEAVLNAAEKKGDGAAMEAILEKRPEAALADTARSTKTSLRDLNKLAMQSVDDPVTVKEVDEARTEIMKSLNDTADTFLREKKGPTPGERLRSAIARP